MIILRPLYLEKLASSIKFTPEYRREQGVSKAIIEEIMAQCRGPEWILGGVIDEKFDIANNKKFQIGGLS
jgi:hypothetical protein